MACLSCATPPACRSSFWLNNNNQLRACTPKAPSQKDGVLFKEPYRAFQKGNTMATFKMIDNDDPNRYAVVVQEGDIKSFRDNPEWVEVIEVVEEPKKKPKAKEE
jgi:hypothetical protein